MNYLPEALEKGAVLMAGAVASFWKAVEVYYADGALE
jgi:hypothetical protein